MVRLPPWSRYRYDRANPYRYCRRRYVEDSTTARCCSQHWMPLDDWGDVSDGAKIV
jgi:hypothetical protein